MAELSGVQLKPLRRHTLQEAVYEQICHLVLTGQLKPGESITVASISEALGTSAMPVREALTRLMALGALTTVSGRSVGIPRLTPEGLKDLRRVRLEVEGVATDWAVRNQRPGFKQQLQAILKDLQAAERGGDPQAFIEENYKFHFIIYRESQSPQLITIIEHMWLKASPYFHHLRELGIFKTSETIHEEIVDAILNDDRERAVQRVKDDIHVASEAILQANILDR